jgi:hypothetical protein
MRIPFSVRIVATLIAGFGIGVVIGSCDQPLPPIQPEPGLPCGRAYVYCPASGNCCHASEEICGTADHACGVGDCCYVGPSFGNKAPRKQLTPDQVHRIEAQ